MCCTNLLQLCLTLCKLWTTAHQAPLPMDSPGKNTGADCHFLLQMIFLTYTESAFLHLLHWQVIHYHLGSLRGPITSVQSLSRVRLFVTPRTEACQASLSITNSWSSLRLMFNKPVIPSSHLILCRPLLLLPQIPPSIRVFSNESLFA